MEENYVSMKEVFIGDDWTITGIIQLNEKEVNVKAKRIATRYDHTNFFDRNCTLQYAEKLSQEILDAPLADHELFIAISEPGGDPDNLPF